MTKTVKERLLNALIALAIAGMALMIGLKISFSYTRKYHDGNSVKSEEVIEKLNYLIDKINKL